jgi:hypothetical protein
VLCSTFSTSVWSRVSIFSSLLLFLFVIFCQYFLWFSVSISMFFPLHTTDYLITGVFIGVVFFCWLIKPDQVDIAYAVVLDPSTRRKINSLQRAKKSYWSVC